MNWKFLRLCHIRFEQQGETTAHLQDLQAAAEKQIDRLREDKEKLQTDFEEMKYSGEAKLSRLVMFRFE